MGRSRKGQEKEVEENREESQCPDCRGEMVHVKMGWECPAPDCDVIRVSTKKGYGWKETRVLRRAVVIQGGKVKEAQKSCTHAGAY